MEDIEFVFDVKRLVFTHEPTGYTMTAQFLLDNNDTRVIEEVYANVGTVIDSHLVTMLRWTAEDFMYSDFDGV